MDFIKKNGFEPKIVKSEIRAKNFDFKINNGKYPIYFFNSNTSGEKKFEEFFDKSDNYNLNDYESLGYIIPEKSVINEDIIIKDFVSVFDNPKSKKIDIVNVIKKYITDFNHIETGKNLDQKM